MDPYEVSVAKFRAIRFRALSPWCLLLVPYLAKLGSESGLPAQELAEFAVLSALRLPRALVQPTAFSCHRQRPSRPTGNYRAALSCYFLLWPTSSHPIKPCLSSDRRDSPVFGDISSTPNWTPRKYIKVKTSQSCDGG